VTASTELARKATSRGGGEAKDAGIDTHRVRSRTRPDAGQTFELQCSSCRYGVVVRVAPAVCPMCLGSVWEHRRTIPAREAEEAG